MFPLFLVMCCCDLCLDACVRQRYPKAFGPCRRPQRGPKGNQGKIGENRGAQGVPQNNRKMGRNWPPIGRNREIIRFLGSPGPYGSIRIHPRPWRPLQNSLSPHFTSPGRPLSENLAQNPTRRTAISTHMGGFGPNRFPKSCPSRRVSADADILSSYGAGRGRIHHGRVGKVGFSMISGP